MKKIVRIIFILALFVSIGFITKGILFNEDVEIRSIDNILLVNKENKLSKDYIPNNLIVPNVRIADEACPEERQVDKSIEKHLKNLFIAADEDNICLYLLSGYRSYKTQENIYEYNLNTQGKQYTEEYVAKPGQSEHQTGLAIDITNNERCFSGSVEAEWLYKNAYKYGFIIRYLEGKEDITGYNYEPWHLRYVGVDVATQIYNKNLTLEEYLLD